MALPRPGDYIDIHVHGGKPADGIFILETLMAHENRMPEKTEGAAFTFGIHPWFLTEQNHEDHLRLVEKLSGNPEIIAIGEAGFDKLRGPSHDLQETIFDAQVRISEESGKPLIIHCVRAWEDVMRQFGKLKPGMPWMIHGFRGKIQLARQLLSKGFFLSIWYEFALRPESSALFRELPGDRFFLETDGADVDIRDMYAKVAGDLGKDVGALKSQLLSNYYKFFRISS
ncbi:MAG TPA: TatD family hydrolase [Bacteroidales bacterium]|jgi:TatD DNase family protein|nr:TatD family hydrolase [Bacteroidales bacterium]